MKKWVAYNKRFSSNSRVTYDKVGQGYLNSDGSIDLVLNLDYGPFHNIQLRQEHVYESLYSKKE